MWVLDISTGYQVIQDYIQRVFVTKFDDYEKLSISLLKMIVKSKKREV